MSGRRRSIVGHRCEELWLLCGRPESGLSARTYASCCIYLGAKMLYSSLRPDFSLSNLVCAAE